MPSFTCWSCRTVLQSRLRAHISHLELLRRGFHVSATACAPTKKGSHITSRYVDTVPPSAEQLKAATYFFNAHAPTKSWTASEWRRHASQHSDDLSDIVPEIAFLGRSNSGKSSLLNALLDRPGLCRVGPRPGKTVTMHAWSLAPVERDRSTKKSAVATDDRPRITVLDMPGYGHGSRSEWGQEIVVYMKRRRQLRRAFVLLNPKHGIKSSDEQILQVLRAEGIAHQIVACKCDEAKPSELAARLEDLGDEVARSASEQHAAGLALSDILAVGNLGDGKGNQKVDATSMKGVDDVRWAMLQATGLEQYAVNFYQESLLPKDKRPLRIINPVREPSRPQTTSRSF